MEYIHDLASQITKLALSPVLIVPALMSIALGIDRNSIPNFIR